MTRLVVWRVPSDMMRVVPSAVVVMPWVVPSPIAAVVPRVIKSAAIPWTVIP